VLDYAKIRTYKVPSLEGFKVRIHTFHATKIGRRMLIDLPQLTPFVAKRVEVEKGRFEGSSPMDPLALIDNWKKTGGIH